jgi:S-DNA-T family DNA segregation ATPase FtsK/SpoIIIE
MSDKKKNKDNDSKKALQETNDNKDKKASKKRKQLTFDAPSEKMIHQILPFAFVVFAILFEVCFVLASLTGTEYVGVAGVFLKDVFLGLLGSCAFLIPIMLLNLAGNWRKFVDTGVVIAKVIFSLLFLISLSGMVHIFIRMQIAPAEDAFLLPREIFEYSYAHLLSSGVVGGFLCECIYALFKSVGTIIIMSALTIVFFIFSLGMTPRNMGIWIRYKWTVMREKKKEHREEQKRIAKEKKDEEEKLRLAEKARIEAEEQAMREAEQRIENERIAAAERRAIEREQKEKSDREKYGEMRFVDPEPYRSTIDQDIEEEKEDDGRVNVATVFKNPPDNFDPNRQPKQAEEKPKQATEKTEQAQKAENNQPKKDAKLDVEIKEMTDIDTVPDDGEEGSVVPENIVREYVKPPVNLLKNYKNESSEETIHTEIRANANALMDTLKSFGVRIQEITYSRGPTITRYELKPDVGVRIRSIANLVDDIALSLATTGVRIEAPIPNKSAVGIEVPNRTLETVGLRSLIDNREFTDKKSILTAALGKDVGGNTVYFDIGKMPHMLIAGTTGSGKSVCINCIIMSILYKASPRDVKLILIDPKKVEFQPYRSIPHLYAPIVTEPKKAAGALASAVAEMERRFELIESVGAKNISGYNELTANDPSKEYLPYIVIIIDELADLMMTAADDVETAICRIAQKARAAGIHLVIGTQRPSVDVVTGLIKANIPSRIAFTVASQVDSKTILDTAGADKLIGRGDMLFAPIGSVKPMRVQGAFIDDREVEAIVEYITENNDGVSFNDAFIARLEEEAAKCGNPKGKGSAVAFDDDGEPGEEGVDPKFKLALDVAIEMGKISTSLLQRRLEIGYGRAAKIIDRMEALGYVSAPDGNKPRAVLVSKAEIMEKRLNDDE